MALYDRFCIQRCIITGYRTRGNVTQIILAMLNILAIPNLNGRYIISSYGQNSLRLDNKRYVFLNYISVPYP